MSLSDPVIVEVTNPETPFAGVQVVGLLSELSGPVTVEVLTPETPFGGVQMERVNDSPVQIEINSGSPVLSVFGRIGNIQPLFSDYDQFYQPLGGLGAAGPSVGAVDSVFGRTGSVTALSTDYAAFYQPLGSGGTGDLSFVFTQVAPSSSWAVTHNLGKFPSVSVVDSGGTEIIPNVIYIDNNHVTVSFGSATSGKAYLN